jgi:hypothetical protein
MSRSADQKRPIGVQADVMLNDRASHADSALWAPHQRNSHVPLVRADRPACSYKTTSRYAQPEGSEAYDRRN